MELLVVRFLLPKRDDGHRNAAPKSARRIAAIPPRTASQVRSRELDFGTVRAWAMYSVNSVSPGDVPTPTEALSSTGSVESGILPPPLHTG